MDTFCMPNHNKRESKLLNNAISRQLPPNGIEDLHFNNTGFRIQQNGDSKFPSGCPITAPSLEISPQQWIIISHALTELRSLLMRTLGHDQAYQKLDAILPGGIFPEIMVMDLRTTCYGVFYYRLTSRLLNYRLI